MEKESRFLKPKKWQDWTAGIVIVLIAVFLLVGFSKMKVDYIMEQGRTNARMILDSMNKGDRLPWSGKENRTLAVLECESTTIFINSEMEKIGSWANGCTYHLARDVRVVLSSKIFKPEGLLTFQVKN